MTFNNFKRGLDILAGHGSHAMCAAHDQFFCGSEEVPLTDEERKEMESLGWFIDEDSWSCFV